jgi:manganese/zinc/iron transport system permease protein
MAVSAAAVCLAAVLLFKEFKLLCFDTQFARGIGFSPKFMDGLLMLLLVLVVVIGMQAVGVVLMSAMLVIPAAAARLWTERLAVMVALAGVIGALSGALGTLFSTMGLRMPTGPLIVISASAMFALSLVFAPRRGILARLLRRIGMKRTVARENALRAIYEWVEKQGKWEAAFSVAEIAGVRRTAPAALARTLGQFEREGLLASADGAWRLNEKGLRTAYGIARNHRLWEMYLMHESHLSADHVDRDADEIEHHLSPAVVAQLEELLRLHSRELKLPGSVHPTLG